MVGKSLLQVSASPAVSSSSLTTLPCNSSSFLPPILQRPRRKCTLIKATSSEAGHGQTPTSEKKSPITVVLDAPTILWRQTLRPLSDFGFGRRCVWEGGVRLFLVSGAVLLALSLAWLRGFQMRSKFRKYLAVFEFPQASGICTGTPVRIRGVTVGNVIHVNPSLRNIEAVVEVEDDKIIIPRNSLVEVNQSGLLMETLIDITPRDPIPTPSRSPLDPECDKDGLIVCDCNAINNNDLVALVNNYKGLVEGNYEAMKESFESLKCFLISTVQEPKRPNGEAQPVGGPSVISNSKVNKLQ